MKWLKNILLDVLITLLILIAVVGDISWLLVIIIVYSALILLLRVAVLFNTDMMHTVYRRMYDTPSWPLHLLYAANVLILGIGGRLLVAGLWALIWLFSWLGERKSKSIDAGKKSPAGH